MTRAQESYIRALTLKYPQHPAQAAANEWIEAFKTTRDPEAASDFAALLANLDTPMGEGVPLQTSRFAAHRLPNPHDPFEAFLTQSNNEREMVGDIPTSVQGGTAISTAFLDEFDDILNLPPASKRPRQSRR